METCIFLEKDFWTPPPLHKKIYNFFTLYFMDKPHNEFNPKPFVNI